MTVRHDDQPLSQAHGLFWIVRNHQQRILAGKTQEQAFNLLRGMNVQGCRRLVQQQHGWLQSQRPRQAKALLLPAGKSLRRRIKAVFDLFPQAHAHERLTGFQAALLFGQARHHFKGQGKVAFHADGQDVGRLKNHAHQAAKLRQGAHGHAGSRIYGLKPAPKIKLHHARRTAVKKGLVQAVQGTQQGGLARTGTPGKHGDAPPGGLHANIVQHLLLPEIHA